MSKRKLPDFETLKHLYLDEKKTLAEICIMFDCSTAMMILSCRFDGGAKWNR